METLVANTSETAFHMLMMDQNLKLLLDYFLAGQFTVPADPMQNMVARANFEQVIASGSILEILFIIGQILGEDIYGELQSFHNTMINLLFPIGEILGTDILLALKKPLGLAKKGGKKEEGKLGFMR
jgi:hypothetical protein